MLFVRLTVNEIEFPEPLVWFCESDSFTPLFTAGVDGFDDEDVLDELLVELDELPGFDDELDELLEELDEPGLPGVTIPELLPFGSVPNTSFPSS